jgi:hypothetical protein
MGTLTSPGSGFFPLVTVLTLGIFPILILAEARKSGNEIVKFWVPEKNITMSFILHNPDRLANLIIMNILLPTC